VKRLILTVLILTQLYSQEEITKNLFETNRGGYSLSPNTLPYLIGMYLRKGGQFKINPSKKQEAILEKQFETMIKQNQTLVKKIKQLELKLMTEVVYKGKNSKELKKLITQISEYKIELQNIHIDCINLVKRSLNKEQYEKLLEIAQDYADSFNLSLGFSSHLKNKVKIYKQAAINIPNNIQTKEKISLGKKLFFDPILSRANNISCASCHDPVKGWSDSIHSHRR